MSFRFPGAGSGGIGSETQVFDPRTAWALNRINRWLRGLAQSQVSESRPGAPGPANSHGLVSFERVSRPTAFLQQMAEETETDENSLVLTDTAPLAVSAETEYLARFVDCVLVVIESGMTTRDEFRQAAKMLERLDAGAVGFALNRVGLAMADPAFRLAIEAVEKHLQTQASKRTQRPEHTNSFATEEPAAGTALPQEDLPRRLFEPEVAAAAAAFARFSAHPDPVDPVDSAVCHPSPMASARLAEAAKPMSIPVAAAPTAETTWHSTISATPARVHEAVQHAPATLVERPEAPAPSPIVEASDGAAPAGAASVISNEHVSPAVAAFGSLAGPEPVQALEPIQPEPSPAQDLPRWLSEAPHLPAPSRPPVIWQAARTLVPRAPDSVAETLPSEPGPSKERQAPLPSAAQSWDRAHDRYSATLTERTNGQTQAASLGESPADLTSRLSGLRNLLFVLGGKNAQRGEEPAERAVFERTISQDILRSDAGSAQGAPSRLVTAQPEVLPPKPVVIDFNKLDDHQGESSTRRDRRAAADGVEILPSRRGQYKRI